MGSGGDGGWHKRCVAEPPYERAVALICVCDVDVVLLILILYKCMQTAAL